LNLRFLVIARCSTVELLTSCFYAARKDLNLQLQFSRAAVLPFATTHLFCVGTVRFELTTPRSQSECANQTALRSVVARKDSILSSLRSPRPKRVFLTLLTSFFTSSQTDRCLRTSVARKDLNLRLFQRSVLPFKLPVKVFTEKASIPHLFFESVLPIELLTICYCFSYRYVCVFCGGKEGLEPSSSRSKRDVLLSTTHQLRRNGRI